MALDLDPIYHTETMVRILRDQGAPLKAMELAEKILETKPEQEGILQVLGELKEEARANFEKFRQSGKNQSGSQESEEAPSEPEARVIALNPQAPTHGKKQRVNQLEGLLGKIKEFKEKHGQS